eukprot:m51a1_g3976 hypothetical protein (1231) ;mRNA; f:432122-436419
MSKLVSSVPYIEFTDFVVGTTYTASLDVRNAGPTGQTLRFRQPGAPFFAKPQAPDGGGDGRFVAPGMSCRCVIEFCPRARGDADAELVVLAGSDDAALPLKVPLRARRSKPMLSLNSAAQCGQCVMGDTKSVVVVATNVGEGTGRFLVAAGESDVPSTDDAFDHAYEAAIANTGPSTAHSVSQQNFVSATAFRLAPKAFELKPGEAITLKVLFAPGAVQGYAHSFVLASACGRKWSLEATGAGCVPTLHPLSLFDDITGLAPIADLSQGVLVATATYDYKGPGVGQSKFLPLKYHWELSAVPFGSLSPYANMMPDSSKAPASKEPAFSVTKGVFEAHQELQFTMKFNPSASGTFACLSSLVIENVPRCVPAMFLSKKGNATYGETPAFLVGMRGFCGSPNVSFDPNTVILPSALSPEQEHTFSVSLVNKGALVASYQYENKFSPGDGLTCEVTPREGTVGAMDKQELSIKIRAVVSSTPPELFSGKERSQITISFPSHRNHPPIVLPVFAEVKRAPLVVAPKLLNFGILPVGHTSKQSFSISTAPGYTAPQEYHVVLGGVGDTSDMVVSGPLEGVIRPGETVTIEAAFTPRAPQHGSYVIEVRAPGVQAQKVSIRANADYARVVLEQCLASLGLLRAGTDVLFPIRMKNIGTLPAHFSWIERDTPDYSVWLKPKEGLIDMGEVQEVTCVFHPHKRTIPPLSPLEVLVACLVDDMPSPLGVLVACQVQGLVLSCTLSNSVCFNLPLAENERPPAVVFCDNTPIPIFTASSTILKIKNESAHVTNITNGGFALSVSQPSVRIGPGETFALTVSCYADLCGCFTDFLVIEADGLQKVMLPLQVNVSGTPLTLQPNTLGMDVTQSPPNVSWGALPPLPASEAIVTQAVSPKRPSTPSNIRRIVKIANASPFDVALRWRFETAEGGFAVSPPFSAQPPTGIVPSAGSAEFTFVFRSTDIGTFGWRAIADARPLYPEQPAAPPGTSTQAQAHVPPIELLLAARTVAPALDTAPDKRLEVLVPVQPASTDDSKLSREVVFSNPHNFSLDFTLESQPSLLFAVDVPVSAPRSADGRWLTLGPGKSLTVGVSFLWRTLLTRAAPPFADNDVAGTIRILFASNAVQTYSLVAHVRFPQLECSPPSLEFGPVPLGESRVLTFDVINVSPAGTPWVAAIEGDASFTATPTSGYAGATSTQVRVTYAPQGMDAHEAALRICPDRANVVVVPLRGSGAYNEQNL